MPCRTQVLGSFFHDEVVSMIKHFPFAFVSSCILCVTATSCSSGDYCRDNCEYMQRCNPDMASVQNVDACVDACEQQLAGVSEDCRDALDDLGGCAADLDCSDMQTQSDCVDESLDVFEECDGELFNKPESCTGSARDCESLDHDSAQCQAQGCSFAQACDGYVDSCSSVYSQSECEQQVGCTYASDSCTGTAAECTTLTAGQCETQQGCNLEDTCTGTPPACESFGDEQSCESIDGCYW
jgi:hypothetical protein